MSIKVINNRERTFNGVKKGQIVNIPKDKLLEYKIAGFSQIKETGIKKNIVQVTKTFEGVEENWTIKELKEKLDHLGVDYSECKIKEDFQKLLSISLKNINKEENEEDDVIDVKKLKTQLIGEKIVEEEELEGKSDVEIKQIATDNGLI